MFITIADYDTAFPEPPMAQARAAPAARNLSEADFPSLVTKKVVNPPPAPSPTPAPSPPVQRVSPQQYELFGLKSLDSLLQTDFSIQDFGHALSSTIPFIPDPPYDAQTPGPNPDSPPGFPQSPNMKLLQPEFFKKCDESTLFYVFFYYPGTAKQCWAGEELKRREWRFHRKYQTWFHRLSEPTEKTAEFEVAKFEYFDHSTREGWCTRILNAFRFDIEDMGE
jgi:CCR4-NOT transcription complex subunit 3